MTNLGNAIDLIQSFKQVAADRNVSDRRRFDLAEVTEQVVRGLRFGLRGKNMTVSVECEPDLAMNSYPGPYGQVLTNLVLNAAVHAFPDGAGGSVHIAAQASGRDKVEVVFSDDGCGMSPEVRRQVFDPFFTTRRDQGTTGLGLAHRLQHRDQSPRRPDPSGNQTGRGNEIPDHRAAQRAAGVGRGVGVEPFPFRLNWNGALSFCFDAFSSREPGSTSLENALIPHRSRQQGLCLFGRFDE